jgi:hypothetical protein
LATCSASFIIRVIDDTRLFVKPTAVDLIRKEIAAFQQKNTYDPPSKEELRQQR